MKANATLRSDDGDDQRSYRAVYDGGRFVIDPLELDTAKDWAWNARGWLYLELTIDGPAGVATESVGFRIFPSKPAAGIAFRIINFALPFAVLGLFVMIYQAKRVRLRTQTI